MTTRRRPWSTLGWSSERGRSAGFAFIVLFLFVVFIDARRLGHIHTTDSDNLVKGTRQAIDCLRDGQFFRCGGGLGKVEVFPYPLLQYLPAAVLIQLGLSDSSLLEWFGVISFLAFAGSLLLVVRTFRERPRHGALIVVSLLASSFLYHSTSAFGEGLTAALVIAAVVAAVRRRPVLLFVLVLMSSLGKETLAPFVVVLALVCARAENDAWLPARKFTIAALGGGITGILLNFAFNLFRYGSIKNLLYLEEVFRTPGIWQKIVFFGAIVGSPAAGVFWFWPLVSLMFLAGGAIGLSRLIRDRHSPRAYLPVLAVTATLIGWFALLSAWCSPFGWIAYGPRLEVPLLGGFAVSVAHLEGDKMVAALRRSRLAVLATGGALALGALQFGSPWRYALATEELIVPTGSCPAVSQIEIRTDAALYYRCVTEVMWRRHPMVLDDLFDLSASVRGAAWLLAVAGSVLLLWYVAARSENLDGSDRGEC